MIRPTPIRPTYLAGLAIFLFVSSAAEATQHNNVNSSSSLTSVTLARRMYCISHFCTVPVGHKDGRGQTVTAPFAAKINLGALAKLRQHGVDLSAFRLDIGAFTRTGVQTLWAGHPEIKDPSKARGEGCVVVGPDGRPLAKPSLPALPAKLGSLSLEFVSHSTGPNLTLRRLTQSTPADTFAERLTAPYPQGERIQARYINVGDRQGHGRASLVWNKKGADGKTRRVELFQFGAADGVFLQTDLAEIEQAAQFALSRR